MVIAWFALAPQERGQASADGDGPPPVLAPRIEVAGMRAVMGVSTLIYTGLEEQPHELVTRYTFPDRGKWFRSLIGGSHADRQIEYRSGDACWRLDPGETRSVRLVEEARDDLVRRMELRRALLLWPDGFAWEPAGSTVAEPAPAGTEVRRASLGPLGRLEAELGDDGRPVRMRSRDASGVLRETYTEVAWSLPSSPAGRAAGGRAVPAALALEVGGVTLWRETFTEVATRAEFLDLQFVPPDRPAFRPELPTERRVGLPRLEHEVAGRTVRRAPLERGLDLPAALEQASELWRAACEHPPAGRELASEVELELTPAGAPRAVLLALVDGDPADGPPAGWTRAPAQAVRAAYLDALPPEPRATLAAVLEELEASLPAGREADAPRLGFDPRATPGARRLRVVLPLRP